MSSRELSEWQAYYQLEPWGELRDDRRMGILAAILSNMGKKRGAKAAKPEDFFFTSTTQSRQQRGWQQVRSRMAGLFGR